MNHLFVSTILAFAAYTALYAEELPVLETGGKEMPAAWIDSETGHKVFRLTDREGVNKSFYFHNNPFIGDEMIFAGEEGKREGDDQNFAPTHRMQQMYAVNLKTGKTRQVTHEAKAVGTEIVCAATHEIFFRRGDSIIAVHTDTGKRRLVGMMPAGRSGGIVCVNCDGSLLAGTFDDPEQARILREHPQKGSFFNMIYDAHLRKTLFTMDTQTGKIDSIWSENEWVNHLQFSPTDRELLSFCHEGPWHKVDRMWTINVVKKSKPVKMHQRTIPMEIAGHEWFGNQGQYLWFDLQKPKSEDFYVGRVDLKTLKEDDYKIKREEWSVHFVTSWDETFLAGDGGDPVHSVAHSPYDQWIYLYRYAGDRLETEKLVNMKNHNYKLEPNVHFSPDQKWIIFRANFEGYENVYGVEIDLARPIMVNSLGYKMNVPKVASIPGAEADVEFCLCEAKTGEVVFRGKTSVPRYQKDVDQKVAAADFSAFKNPGRFYLRTQEGHHSPVFSIYDEVYHEAFVTAMRAFYLWRCGTDVEGEYHGQTYRQEACHMQDGWDDYIGNKGHQRDGVGGWHDAGDFGKYTVNAAITLHNLFMAWEAFKDKIVEANLDLPTTAQGYPPFLQELKWETDFLLKMQYPDGSGRVSHKLTRVNFAPFIMANLDDEKRYYTPWSSAATAGFAAVMAQAYRTFKPYDEAYANRLLEAAKRSYDFLAANPKDVVFVQGDFKTGGYETTDWDDRIWAAAELWETTGEAIYLKDFEKRAAKVKVEKSFDWGDVADLGLFTYLLSERGGKNTKLVSKIRKSLLMCADSLVQTAQTDVYARPMGGRYFWGCNGGVVRHTILLYVATLIEKNDAYQNAALDALHHVLGRNFYGRSFVTGMGYRPPMFPHDRRSGADGIVAPWPGYLVGGGHTAIDWLDEEARYEYNEVAINWQAPLVFALAWAY